MKKIFVLVFLVSISIVYAQKYIPKTIKANVTSNTPLTNYQEETSFSYDKDKEQFIETNIHESSNKSKNIHIWNKKGQLISSIVYLWDEEKENWKESRKSFIFPDKNKRNEELYLVDNQWEGEATESIQENSKSILNTYILENGEWRLNNQSVTKLNKKGKGIEFLSTLYNLTEKKMENSRKTIYHYKNDTILKKLTEFIWNPNTTKWENVSKNIHKNTKNKKKSLEFRWENSRWKKISKIISTEKQNPKVYTDISYQYNDSLNKLVPYSRNKDIYNDKELRIYSQVDLWDLEKRQWIPSIKQQYTHNEKVNKTKEIHSLFFYPNETNEQLIRNIYNEYGDLVLFEVFVKDNINNSMVLIEKEEYTYNTSIEKKQLLFKGFTDYKQSPNSKYLITKIKTYALTNGVFKLKSEHTFDYQPIN